MNMWSKKICLVLVFVMGGVSSFAQGQGIRVLAAAQEEIYAGEAFAYQITIDGYDQPGSVDLSSLADFAPRSTGGSNISQTSITIINGRRTEQKTLRYAMSYQLTTTKSGRLIIPPVKVEIKGNTYTTNHVEITVLKPAVSENLKLEVFFSETICFVGQPITMTVSWYVPADLVRRVGEFHFNVPVLQDQQNFTFEDADIEAGAQDNPFRIELGAASVVATQKRTRRAGQDYLVVSFSKILIPKQPGEIIVPAAQTIANIDVSQRPSRPRSIFDFDSVFDRFDRRQYRRYLSEAEPLTLTVQPLPLKNQPVDFNGLVGRYSISASANPTQVNVGDPITLTINIGGDLLKHVPMPDLNKIPQMTDNFKIPSEQSAPKITGKKKVFTQTIRAQNEQVTEIPPLPLSYFDVVEEKYVTVYSEAIPLEVTPTKIVTAQQAIGGESIAQASAIEAVRQGIAANFEGPQLLKNAAFSPLAALVQPGYLVLWVVPPGIFLFSIVIRKARADDPTRRKAQLKASACRTAVKQLRQMVGQSEIKAQETANILRCYIGDRFDKPAASLTARDCKEILISHCSESQLVEQFCGALEKAEQSRFAGGPAIDEALNPKTLAEMVKTLNRHLRK